jgi:UDP-N-acetyl-D-glucosamine dehydrogenase
VRESPALKIIALLDELGAEVVYHDPLVAEIEVGARRSLELDDALAGADVALIVTAHRALDYDALAQRVPCVLDLRGVTAPAPNVVRL